MKNAILLSFVLLFACQEEREYIKPKKRQLIEAVNASGTVKPFEEYTLNSISSGNIEKLYFEEGDTLELGQPLLKIKYGNAKSNLKAAETVLNKAKINLGPTSPILRDLLDRKEVVIKKYELDSLNLIRYRRLYEKETISKSKLEEYEMQFIRAHSDVNSTKKLIDQTQNKLLIELENAKANYKAIKENRKYCSFKSTGSGKIYEIYKQSGDPVNQGDPIALIGSADSMLIKLNVDRLDLGKLEEAQKVILNFDEYTETVFEAKIGKIYPILNKNDQMIIVDAFFTKMPKKIYNGLIVDANIIVNNKKSVLSIPKEYLFSGDSVRILENGDIKNKIIKKGLENENYVEVLSGLTKDSRIVK